jgi:hypothetical protein
MQWPSGCSPPVKFTEHIEVDEPDKDLNLPQRLLADWLKSKNPARATARRRSRSSRAARSRCSTTCTSSADGSDEQMFGAE